MRWLTANLYPLAILGIVLVGFSLFKVRLVMPKGLLLKGLFSCGLGCLLLTAIGAIMVVRGNPGQVETIDEEEHGQTNTEVPESAVERLRLKWDSEGPANWPASESLAVLSDAAYLPPIKAQKRFHELGFSEFMPVVSSSMIGYIISGEDVTVIVFRGTDFAETSDWIANLGRSATDTPHGAIHSGFYNAYHSMKSQVDQILEGRNLEHLWVTGHSLGGALALVCTYDQIQNEHRKIDGVITFGQPMVARQQLANYLDSLLIGRYARFVNGSDVVARIPPSHAPCGSLVWFTAGGVKRSKRRPATYSAPGPGVTPSPESPPKFAPADVGEIQPLSDEEFQRLQAELAAKGEPKRLLDEIPVYQMSSPLIDDHSMSLYVEKVHALLAE